jgi:transposase
MDTIEVSVAKGRKRRIWTDDEKRMICAQTRVPGVSVSQVAQRYDVNANLVFTWLRDPRFADAGRDGVPAAFLPVEIVATEESPASERRGEGQIEIELASGHRMRVAGGYDPEALARLIRGLSG